MYESKEREKKFIDASIKKTITEVSNSEDLFNKLLEEFKEYSESVKQLLSLKKQYLEKIDNYVEGRPSVMPDTFSGVISKNYVSDIKSDSDAMSKLVDEIESIENQKNLLEVSIKRLFKQFSLSLNDSLSSTNASLAYIDQLTVEISEVYGTPSLSKST